MIRLRDPRLQSFMVMGNSPSVNHIFDYKLPLLLQRTTRYNESRMEQAYQVNLQYAGEEEVEWVLHIPHDHVAKEATVTCRFPRRGPSLVIFRGMDALDWFQIFTMGNLTQFVQRWATAQERIHGPTYFYDYDRGVYGHA